MPKGVGHEHEELIMATELKIRPLDDRVVVEPLEAEEKTAGGILLPDTAKEKPQRGRVLAVGPGKLQDDGKRQALGVAVNDEVLYGRYAGNEIKINGKEIKIMRESDILAKVVK
jgi:chaperonin GroES